MGEKSTKIINSIRLILKEGPKSISEIAKKVETNWKTAEQHLELLKSLGIVKEENTKKTRTFFYVDENNYFDLFIKKKDSELISTIYYQTKKFFKKFFKKEPTKTQAYKILWKVSQKLNYNLPIGWYRYGPCCVQVYENDGIEVKALNIKALNNKEIIIIKDVVNEYGSYDNIELQKLIYKEWDDKLYQTKEILYCDKFENKNDLNLVLMDLIKYSPSETIEVVTDFARATLLIGWNEAKNCFIDYVWPFIALVRFKEDLKKYYGEHVLNLYLKEKINDKKREAQLTIMNLVQAYTNSGNTTSTKSSQHP